MFKHITYKIKSFFKNIHNLIKWFPVVWNDRDYDWNPLVRVIAFKLYNMSEFHRKEGMSEKSDEVADQLDKLSDIAYKIAEEGYVDEAFNRHEYLLEKNEMIIVPKNDGSGLSTIEFVGLTEEERKLKMELHDLEDRLMDKDIDKLFDEMKKHLRGWWD